MLIIIIIWIWLEIQKLVYKKENLSLYKYNINAIYLLMKKVPPFLDDIYEKCSMVEEKLKKGGHKWNLCK